MVHKPKEGIFRAEEGDRDYEFWRLRVELKKLVYWFMNNGPLTWIVMWGFRWMNIKVDFSSHMQDAWADSGFIEFGRNVTVGQGAVVMSSMVVGKYLIIKKVVLGDYSVVGGLNLISPGTIIGKESITGAFSATIPNQNVEQGWIYLGPHYARKLKPNKFAEQRRDLIYKKHVDEEIKYEVKQEINIDEDKKELVKNNKEEE
jgi:carbonic anhydrase/acetyltransferase-like protein (isoleucine patch superfamily)